MPFLCSACGSTFSATRLAIMPLTCSACGARNTLAETGSAPAIMTCKTCEFQWPIIGPESVRVCPSCGGNPFIKGELTERDGVMKWISVDDLRQAGIGPALDEYSPAPPPPPTLLMPKTLSDYIDAMRASREAGSQSNVGHTEPIGPPIVAHSTSRKIELE